MAEINVIVLRAAGINCDGETMHAWRLAGAAPRLVQVNELLAKPALLDEAQVLTLPGGFSYGDDIAAGTILANRLTRRLGETLAAFVDRGGLVLGICNGFQVLLKMGLLPGGSTGPQTVSLTVNTSARFEDRWVRVRVDTDRCPFLQAGPLWEAPVAHAEGRLVVDSDATLAALTDHGHVALRYVDADGLPGDYPVNPNGSVDGVAGLTDATGRVLGLMPHPERNVDRTQHPLWTRRPADAPATGLQVFRSAVAALG
ncbi:MAG: phosphoribosylformylglycinamidine synthase I [Planctomycetes bacterium]|nr:phosphoribosylformylglycinamidine synthase I [Planctomycetota bacterium]